MLFRILAVVFVVCVLLMAVPVFVAADVDPEVASRISQAYTLSIINGNYTKAENFADRDITLYSLMRSAETYTKMGMTDDARGRWQLLISRYPSDPITEKAKKELQKLGGG